MIPAEQNRQWHDRIVRCSVSCAKTMEARKIKAHEAPLIIGALVKGLSDHTGLPVETILAMVATAAHAKETPDSAPTPIPS